MIELFLYACITLALLTVVAAYGVLLWDPDFLRYEL
jgi:hypothetical protein